MGCCNGPMCSGGKHGWECLESDPVSDLKENLLSIIKPNKSLKVAARARTSPNHEWKYLLSNNYETAIMDRSFLWYKWLGKETTEPVDYYNCQVVHYVKGVWELVENLNGGLKGLVKVPDIL